MSYAGPSEREGSFDPAETADRRDPVPEGVCAAIEEGETRECTLYPEGVEGVDLMTRWVTAAEGSFVALSETR